MPQMIQIATEKPSLSVCISVYTADGLQSTIDFEGFKGGTRGAPLCLETQSLGQHMLERWEKMG